MNVVVVLPTPESGYGAVQFWKMRLKPEDRFYLVSIVNSTEREVGGVAIRYLEIDPRRDRQWPSRWIRATGWRLVARGYGIWRQYLADIWDELHWNLRSFDPDVIDLRWLNGRNELERRLREKSWAVVASERDISHLPENLGGWRKYDPNKKVSIVLPVYNGGQFVRQSIESCLTQTHSNLELILVDDCSKDNTPAIMAEYAARDPRVRSIRNATNQRLPRSLNIGFAATSGELLTWTSHDNFYEPSAIKSLVGYLSTWSDVDLVYSDYLRIDETGKAPPVVNVLPPPWMLLSGNVVGAYFLYRRNVYEKVGDYRADREYAEDYDYWVRIYKAGFSMMRLREPLYSYRTHPDSMTSEAAKMVDNPHRADRVVNDYFKV